MSNQYRKKPVVIQAVQFTEAMRDANLFDGKPLPEGMKRGRAEYPPGRRQVYSSYFYIETLEGRMEVSVGDWIITGVKGEHYPCKPDIFAATYEDVAARELDVEAERREDILRAALIEARSAMGHPDNIAAIDTALSRAARRAAQGTAPESAQVSTEQAGDAWISVEDERKPDIGEVVLLYVRTQKRGWLGDIECQSEAAQVEMGEYRRGESAEMSYFDCYASPIGDNDWVTHWRRMPAAPSPNNSPVGAEKEPK